MSYVRRLVLLTSEQLPPAYHSRRRYAAREKKWTQEWPSGRRQGKKRRWRRRLTNESTFKGTMVILHFPFDTNDIVDKDFLAGVFRQAK
jgi:hypothetical protein